MKIHFYGSGAGPVAGNIYASSFSVEHKREILLFDVGSISVMGDGLLMKRLNSVFVSHSHIDHIFFLPFLLMKHQKTNKKRKVDVYVPANSLFTKRILNLFTRKFKNIKIHLVTGGKKKVGGFIINQIETEHSKVGHAYSIVSGRKKVVYTGDTRYFENLPRFCRNADLLITELTHKDSFERLAKVRGHMTPKQVLKLLKEAKPKAVVLTHFGTIGEKAAIESIRKEFKGKIYVAKRGLEIKI